MSRVPDDGSDAPTDASTDALIDEQTDAAPAEDDDERQVGFEILEIQSPNSIRAWISPEITWDEFETLEVPRGWIKNQPRESIECRADDIQFRRSPDATMDGEILVEEHFGHRWFHAATVTQPNVSVDDEGLFNGTVVRKFHELTFNAGRCMVLLVSPDDEVYYRVGRDATRTMDTPTLPTGWRLVDYTTPERLVIQLFDETLVIRTDNQDSFQGPVPELRGAL